MFSIFLTGAIMIAGQSAPDAPFNNRPITIEETGVATNYEATKTIICGNVEWRVKWKSGPDKKQIRGDITVVKAGESRALPEAQAEVFGKFSAVDGVSATCNKTPDNKVVRSSLIVIGHGMENRGKSLAQVYVEPDFKTQWSFNAVGD